MKEIDGKVLDEIIRSKAVEAEKAADILASIEAVHGKKARDAIFALGDMVAAQTSFYRFVSVTSPVPQTVMDLVTSPIDGYMTEVARNMLHLAIVGHVPQCEENNCGCDPEVMQARKMMQVYMRMLVDEQSLCVKNIEQLIK